MSRTVFLQEEEFELENAENYTDLYFPVANEKGLKSSVTPNLGGDAKENQNAFLLEPVSAANLHNNRGSRNVWIHVENKGVWSAVGASAEEESKKFTDEQDASKLKAGYMWQTVTRSSKKYQLSSEVTVFSPLSQDVEIMKIKITNDASEVAFITPTVAIPIYGRSADNIRDHRHVTAMLHRIEAKEYGVFVTPTLSFDERGHKKNNLTYFVCGVTGDGEKPEDFYLLEDEFIGEGGTLTRPYTVVKNLKGVPAGSKAEGKEAMGGLHFEGRTILPGESVYYTVVMGIREDAEVDDIMQEFDSVDKVDLALSNLSNYWKQKVNVACYTGNASMDGLMKWVSFQPFLRRIYGCSFLPHHDYGRGGRGWRDLWQDCLSLLIMDPKDVRGMIVDNYGGVRIDGTNATIIGSNQGEFIADRNGIARVWMDHGVWPFITTKLYVDQTGDVDVLKEQVAYFKDEQCERGTKLDEEWDAAYGVMQLAENKEIYKGSILEHILLENLCAFYEVGEHNHMRLRGADWNDALDMAAERGESVAFTAAYAGNLDSLADLLEVCEKKYGWNSVEILDEIQVLLADDQSMYDGIEAKKAVLAEYLSKCKHNVSGKKVQVATASLVMNLREKAAWIKKHIRETEWIEKDNEGWFNSYYDNDGQSVEGFYESGVRMMLTGQVFTIMSETALEEQVQSICKSADNYLYKEDIGGYRLNSNFHEEKYNMGRMFGFAYGEKENGAVFSHMAVMYANALYKRGFAKEGFKALNALASQSMNFEKSKIYPGIPEYFDAKGRGLYHYLTGAASWYLLTYVTEVFGVRGEYGALTIAPKLVQDQFDENGKASICLNYASRTFEIEMNNEKTLDYGEYKIVSACIDDGKQLTLTEGKAVLPIEELEALSYGRHTIQVVLG